MPGIATHFEILRLTIDDLQQASSGPALNQIGAVMGNNSPYAHLGAIGAAIGDFMPAQRPAGQSSGPDGAYADVWRSILNVVAGDIGLLASLTTIKQTICKMDRIVSAEDQDALIDMQESGEFDAITTTSSNFADIVQGLPDIAKAIATTIRTDLRPAVCTSATTDPVPPASAWQIRDLLHWSHSGLFLRKLLDRATASGDPRFLAYAYGFLVSYAADVCGNPFVNSTVGGPPRTQWWRQRFVRNYVDAWVFGAYSIGATMTEDTPSPAYADWPSLCDANLQERIALDGIDLTTLLRCVKISTAFPQDVLPADFSAFWIGAYSDAYGAPASTGPVTADGLNDAYLMTWLVLWFQTSGAVLGWFSCDGDNPVANCSFAESMTPPSNCGDDPSALDPFQKDPATNAPLLPPQPQIDTGAAKRNTICGRILQILGAVVAVSTGFAAGVTIFAAGTATVASAIDWDNLRCQLYWFRKYLYNGLQGLQDLLGVSGFGYPRAVSLGEDELALNLLGIPHTWKAGKVVVKSQISDNTFPSKPVVFNEVDFLLTFNDAPTSTDPGFETPRSAACLASVYPTFFVDDDAQNPLSNGDIKNAGKTFPDRHTTAIGTTPVQFGNAVANALDLFKHLSITFPDWNLDADRGLAYKAWQFKDFYNPDAVAIEPAP